VNRRAELLDASKVLETAALDPYEFIRDAYLQRRRNLVYDGAPPPPGRDFPDAPPKPQSPPPKQSGFPTGDEPGSVGSVLVSGESHTAVQTAFPQGALPQPAALSKPAPKLADADTAAPAPGLAQFWRVLKLNLAPRE
jgi:hypothetical protein